MTDFKLVRENNKLYVLYHFADSFKPERVQLWWPVISTEGWVPCWFEPEGSARSEQAVSEPRYCRLCGQHGDGVIHNIGGTVLELSGREGRYGGLLANGGRYAVRIDSKAKAVRAETIPIPCPKVRKGLETRYANGHWQKYLKSEGWVNL